MSLEAPTDAELVARAAAGEGDAFQQLFARHRPRVTAVCRQRLHSSSDVDDAVQEAFARALANLSGLKHPARFASWVTTIAIRACNDHHRASRRTVVVDLAVESDAQLEDAGPRPDELVMAAEHSAAVRATLAGLGDRDREALLLRHVAEAPVSVVASKLGLTEGSARVLLTRARRRLRAATTRLPVLIPVSWRQWLREHLPTATPTLEAVAAVVAITVAAASVISTPHGEQEAPAVAHETAIGDATSAPSASPDPLRRQHRDASRSTMARAMTRSAAAAEHDARPAGPSLAPVAESVQVRDEYPEEEETQEIVDVSVFTGDDQTNLRVYADEVTDHVRGSGLAGGLTQR